MRILFCNFRHMYQTLGLMKTGIRLLILAVSVVALSACGGNRHVTMEEYGGLRATIELKSPNAMNAIKDRIEKSGIPNVSFKKESSRPLFIVEFPGLRDIERVKTLLAASGNLEFWPTFNVKDVPVFSSFNNQPDDYIPAAFVQLFALLGHDDSYCYGARLGLAKEADTAQINNILSSPRIKEYLPKGLRTYWSLKPFVNTDDVYELVAINASDGKAPLDGSYITEVSVETEPTPLVNIQLNDEGTKIWEWLTTNNVGEQIAMVLDGKVLSAPLVNSAITLGKSQISGEFTIEEVNDMANILESSKNPIRVVIKEIERVEPTAK